MAKFTEFGTVYGKLGMHPGNLTTEQAVALFNHAMKCKEGALLLDQWPDAGRTSVLLAAVARNLDGKLKVVTRWEAGPQYGPQLFERVYRTHKLKDVATVMDHSQANGYDQDADFAVARAETLPIMNGDLNGAKQIFVYGGGQVKMDGYEAKEQGPGWVLMERSVWA
jgi:hypothetical protein